MDATIDPSAATAITCENCSTVSNGLKFCPTCSFPVGGTDIEKMGFRSRVSIRESLLKDAEKKMKSAKVIIYVIAGVVLLQGFYQGFALDDFATMIVNLCISALYLILAAWSDRNAFGAILTAFIVYVTLNVVNAFFEPASIFSGIIVKIFFIAAFVKGIRSGYEAKGLMEELNKLKGGSVGGI